MTVEEFESITGRGVSGIVGGRTYYVGNEALLDEHGIAVGIITRIIKRNL